MQHFSQIVPRVCTSVHFIVIFLTLGAHARGLQYLSCLCVCLSVCFPYSGTSRNQAYKQQYQRLQRDTGMKCKKGFFFKTLRSEVMASFTHLEWLRRRFRDPSAVLSTKLGSTLIRKPIATVSLHRQRTSRRQRANLHRLVNGDVYGSRILIATPTPLSHVRATRCSDNRLIPHLFRICAHVRAWYLA